MPKLSIFAARTGTKQEPQPLTEPRVPPLKMWEKFLAAFTAVGAAAVGGLGLAASFGAVSDAAARWGFDDPWMLPSAIDAAIPVFTVANLMLIRMDMQLAWVRLVPWALTLVTCALNVAAGKSFWAQVAHGTMPLLWVAFSEIAAHIYAVRIGAATGRRIEKVRWARWLLSPLPTFKLWRRMRLWELRSYEQVIKLEQDRLIYRARLQARYGRGWRRKAPVESLMPLRLAKHGVPLADTAPAGLAAAGIGPLEFVALPAPAPVAERNPSPAPATVMASKSARPVVTAAVPAQVEPSGSGRSITGPPAENSDDAPLEPLSETALYEIVKAAIKAGEADRFKSGDLTGTAMGRAMGQSAGNGRKVRKRLLNQYAAETGRELPDEFTIEDLMTAANG